MSRLLLISAIVGFTLAAWSSLETPSSRPVVAGVLRQQISFAANTHLISDEAREFLFTKETEAAQTYADRERQSDF